MESTETGWRISSISGVPNLRAGAGLNDLVIAAGEGGAVVISSDKDSRSN